MAISSPTRDFTRDNPTATALNTVIRTAQITLFKVVLSNTNRVTDLDAAGVQQVLENIGSTCMIAQADASGREILIVCDGHAVDVNALAQAIGRMFDAAGTPGSLTAAGVYTANGTGGTVTVTEPSDLFGL